MLGDLDRLEKNLDIPSYAKSTDLLVDMSRGEFLVKVIGDYLWVASENSLDNMMWAIRYKKGVAVYPTEGNNIRHIIYTDCYGVAPSLSVEVLPTDFAMEEKNVGREEMSTIYMYEKPLKVEPFSRSLVFNDSLKIVSVEEINDKLVRRGQRAHYSEKLVPGDFFRDIEDLPENKLPDVIMDFHKNLEVSDRNAKDIYR